jgi:hypothetical protein
MYKSMPSSHSGRSQSLRRDALGIALVRTCGRTAQPPHAYTPPARTWSSLVRFRPAAFSTDASVTMASPMMNAATAFWCGAWCAGCPVGEGTADDVAELIVCAAAGGYMRAGRGEEAADGCFGAGTAAASADDAAWGWHTWMKPRTGHLILLGAMEALRDRLAVP